MIVKITFFVIFSALSLNSFTGKFLIDTKLLGQPTKDIVRIILNIKNTSNESVKLLKDRRIDFKYEKIKSIGNYVIEIERLENGEYKLFSPSADIDPSFGDEEYISLNKNDNITDTIKINGYIFSRNEALNRGFPSGKYRIKVYFNLNMWNQTEENSSKWIFFEIE
jgi:hypothetical protein